MSKKSVLTLLAIECLLFLIVIAGILCHYHNEQDRWEYNMTVLNDSMSVIMMKDSAILYEKCMLQLEYDEISKYLDIEKTKLKELRDSLKCNIDMIANINASINTDTIIIKDIQKDSFPVNFNYTDRWLKLSGLVDSSSVRINSINLPVNLIVGIGENNNIFIEKDNPYLSISGIQASQLVEPKKSSRWSIGVHAGVGFQYGLIRKGFDFGPYIGIGINYKLF